MNYEKKLEVWKEKYLLQNAFISDTHVFLCWRSGMLWDTLAQWKVKFNFIITKGTHWPLKSYTIQSNANKTIKTTTKLALVTQVNKINSTLNIIKVVLRFTNSL